ncbi:T9SS type A sorting domain-containing protein [Chryseobacterium sp. c4a]|uniref:RCC1 domain-containing protein n=1 Tax=Chryseobacterium sp. c4a TaxID=1573582 RepID=UPI001356AFB0|nr:T9SS type A sorting domain-containing protein [Chryseobacterium sp. c4a]
MKNYIYSIFALFMVMLCPAQLYVSQAEYFWDNDPGAGNGTAVLASDGSFNSAFEQLTKTGIATPGNGLHKLSIRIKDNTGVWGPVFTNIINVQQNQTSTILALSQAEYFWDTDPGSGNGTPVLAADGSFDSAFEQLTKTGITTPGNGLHKLSIRIKDNTGVWGPVFTNVINVQQNQTSTILALSQAEYFWDTDPGTGNATPVLAADGNFDSSFEQLTKTGIGLPANGLHVFNIRIKDNTGTWGPVFKNVINVETPASSGCWESLSAGRQHSLGIKPDGTLWAWGNNQTGQLGDGATINRNVAVQIGTATNWKSVSAGEQYTVALKTDGTLWAWGSNFDGQLGDGTKTDRYAPVQVGTATNWKSISAGSFHVLALKTDGTVWAWGRNNYGQLGDGTNTGKLVPTQIGTATNWQSVDAGTLHSLALKTDGTLWSWGYNYSGQLGYGGSGYTSVPTQIGTTNDWKTISAGTYHSTAIKKNGTLWTWGSNLSGQLGDGTTTNKNTPIQIGTETNWLNIGAGSSTTFANKTDGTLWIWGNPFHTQTSGIDNTLPRQVNSSSDNMQMAVGESHILVKALDGSLKVYGSNMYGQLGNGMDGMNNDTSTFISIECPSNCSPQIQLSVNDITSTTATLKWTTSTSVSNGYMYLYSTSPLVGGIDGKTYSNKVDLTNLLSNTTYYWWVATDCKTSQGSWIPGGSFKTLPTTETGCWQSISGGNSHSVGIKKDGTLWAWGRNEYGQLGIGYTDSQSTPKQIGSANSWKKASAGHYHSAAIKADGTLWTWGDNSYGQLGNGAGYSQATPIQMGTATDWVDVASGDSYVIALKLNGTLWAWGLNDSGQLGDGTMVNKNVPIQIGTANNWKMVAPSIDYTLALKTDGTLWAWGNNYYGQLGDGSTTKRMSPIQVGIASNWKSIGVGNANSLGIKTNGTLWTWGFSGALGDGTNTNRATPAQVGTATNWQSVGGGWYNCTGLKTDGTLWAWGLNFYGELGDGTQISKSTPVQIGTASDKQSIAVGTTRIFAIDTNGFLSGCGDNSYGGIGDGTYVFRKIFVPVACSTSDLAVTEVAAKADQLKVYPNPVQDILTVSLDQKIFMVTVYNAAGQVILTKALNDTKGTIDFTALPSGVYLVKVTAANDFVKTVKVIKR